MAVEADNVGACAEVERVICLRTVVYIYKNILDVLTPKLSCDCCTDTNANCCCRKTIDFRHYTMLLFLVAMLHL